MIPSRVQDLSICFSKLKQGAYGVALTDANLRAGKRFPVKNPIFGQHDSTYWTDLGFTMRGNDFATQDVETSRTLKDSLVVPGVTWLLGYLFAFAMGKVTSTQPNLALNPTAWQHVIEFLSPAVDGKDLPVTTIFEQTAIAANLQRRLLDIAMGTVTLEFPPDDVLMLTAAMIGSGRVTPGVMTGGPLPALADLTSVLRSNDTVFKYGPVGAPVDISDEIVRGSVKLSVSWNPDEANARALGSGLYLQRLWVGTPQINVSFDRFVDDTSSTPNDDKDADTLQELNIEVDGKVIGVGPEKHSIIIDAPAVKPEVLKLGQAGDKTKYQYSFGPSRFFSPGGAAPLTITVVNTEPSYFA